jgi:hypothetical protein
LPNHMMNVGLLGPAIRLQMVKVGLKNCHEKANATDGCP